MVSRSAFATSAASAGTPIGTPSAIMLRYTAMPMADGVPIGVPAEAAEVAKATLGGAVSVAQQLPDQLRAELLGTARDAFAQSVRLTAAISAVISLAMAIIVRVWLRQRTSS